MLCGLEEKAFKKVLGGYVKIGVDLGCDFSFFQLF